MAAAGQKAEALGAGAIGKATFASYNIRNLLAHGAVGWPEEVTRSAALTVQIASLACRVMLFAAQRLSIQLMPDTASTTVWSDMKGETETKRFQDILPFLHLQGDPWI